MNSLTAWGLQEAYKKVEILGDKLSVITRFIEWESFRPLLDDMYYNKTEVEGYPPKLWHPLRITNDFFGGFV